MALAYSISKNVEKELGTLLDSVLKEHDANDPMIRALVGIVEAEKAELKGIIAMCRDELR